MCIRDRGTATFPVLNTLLWVKHLLFSRPLLLICYYTAVVILLSVNLYFNSSRLVSLPYQKGWRKGRRGDAYLKSNFLDDSRLCVQDVILLVPQLYESLGSETN